ncbi:hypothetical protein Tco_0320707 [Tanacetum coccineum]
MVAYLKKPDGTEEFHQIVDFLNASHIRYALTENPTIYVSLIKQFWETATAITLDTGEVKLTTTIDGKVKIVTEASVRRHVQLADSDGISSLPNTKIIEQLSLMGYVSTSDKLTFQKGHFSPQWRFLIHTILHCLSPKKTSWEEFSSNIATAIIYVATNRKFNYSKLIFDGMVKNMDSKHKFLMYPRFIQVTNIAQKDKNEAKRAKPSTGMKRVREIKFEETFSEAWDRFKDLLRACLHHGFTEFHQLDTFFNGLNPSDQDSLNSAAGGNLLERSAQDMLKIIEKKSKVFYSRNKAIVSQVKASNVDSSKIASAVASSVTSAMTAMFKQHQVTPALASVKAVEESCVTCGGAHSYRQCPATDGNTFSGYQDNIQGYVSAATMNYNQGNTGYHP